MTVRPDTWIPQVWSHADVMDMQARLDPARMTEYADHWRRVVGDACAVFTRLDAEVTRHLENSWRGRAARQVLEALRRYISEALDGLARCRSLADGLSAVSDAAAELRASIEGLEHDAALALVRAGYSEPAIAAANAVGEIPWPPSLPGVGAAAAGVPPMSLPAVTTPTTAPAGFGGSPAAAGTDWTSPSLALGHNRFDGYDGTAATYPTGMAPPRPAVRDTDIPLPPASNAAMTAATPSSAPVPTTAPPGVVAPAGGVMPYAPLMGAAYPGALARDDGATRRTPGYLISIDNGNELIGTLPKVAPPVLGDW
jgi:hypothetical protein